MWAVAWRLHRLQVLTLLGVMLLAAAAMVAFRLRLLALFARYGCDPSLMWTECTDELGQDVFWSGGTSFSWLSGLMHMAMIIGPVVLGAFAAAPLFTREFARGTQVLALTQSISRARWFTVKVVTLAVPLTVGLLALGWVMQWMDAAIGQTAYQSLAGTNFFARGPIPAATGLVAFGLALLIGMLARSITAVLVATIIVGGAILVGAAAAQPSLWAADRTVTPLAQIYAPVTQAELDEQAAAAAAAEDNPEPVEEPDEEDVDRDARAVRSGVLDESGRVVDVPNSVWQTCYSEGREAAERAAVAAGLVDAPAPTPPPGQAYAYEEGGYQMTAIYLNAQRAAELDCYTRDHMVSQFYDMLPGSALWPLRAVISAIFLVLTALLIGASVRLLPRAVARR